MPEPIQLINGGGIIPLDLDRFLTPAYRVDPATLPPLPAGVTIRDLAETVWAAHNRGETAVRDALSREIQVRECGYLPHYCPETGRDQHGFDQNGLDVDGRDRLGFRSEERESDPMLDDRPRNPDYVRSGKPDRRKNASGRVGNRGNARGNVRLSEDGTERSLQQCWFDLFTANEVLPVHHRLTDLELVEKIKGWFPGRETKRMLDVKQMRWNYNKGRLPCQSGNAPKWDSHSYLRTETHVYRMSPRGRILQQWDVTAAILGEAAGRD